MGAENIFLRKFIYDLSMSSERRVQPERETLFAVGCKAYLHILTCFDLA